MISLNVIVIISCCKVALNACLVLQPFFKNVNSGVPLFPFFFPSRHYSSALAYSQATFYFR